MSDFPFPRPNTENMELAAANRRLTTAILGMTLLTGLVACLAYLAGRTVTHIKTETATVTRTEIPAGPVVVHPLEAPPAAAITPSAKPAPASVPAGSYLQVGLMNPALDRSMQDRLEQQGLKVSLAPLENSTAFRVLVGPFPSSTEQSQVESKLQALGFQYFPRRY